MLEEALLKYKSKLGEDIDVYFRSYRVFGQYRFSIRIKAASFDPFTLEENPMSFMLQSIMSSFENGMDAWCLQSEIICIDSIRKKHKLAKNK